MNRAPTAGRIAACLWAGPNTLLGLLAGGAVLCFGGQAQRIRGVVEFSGGLLGAVAAAMPAPMRFSAITFGHVILGVSKAELSAVREHEHVHVRQYERWGPLFLPAYAASSAWQLICGRHGYRDNFFEREAYAADASLRAAVKPAASERR
ncbi:MAG: signal peptide prediction [Pseudomonadota bacterium]